MSLRESIGRRKPQQFGSDGRYRALFNGARGGEVEAVSTLLGEGLLVNCAGPRGATPLHIAARFGQPQMVSLLIAQKADPMAKDERGHTPLEKARTSGSEEIMRQLQGAMVPTAFDSRCRKLLEAAHKGDVARVRELCASQTELVRQRGRAGMVIDQTPHWQCPSSAHTPPWVAPGGYGRFCTTREGVRGTGCLATASVARTSRLQSRRFHCL